VPQVGSEPRLGIFLQAEDELLGLARRLDEPASAEPYPLALLGLGQRSGSLFRGFLELQGGNARVVAPVLLRTMVEINIVIRFLKKDPDLHCELWEAEADRLTLAAIDEYLKSPLMEQRWGPLELAEAEIQARQERMAEARKQGREASVRGIKPKGSVWPHPIG
jgi:hypothetical protein